MIKGIFNAARNLQLGEKQIGIIANNLANLNTSGYKKAMPFYQILTEEGRMVAKQVTDHSQGEQLFTGNPMDLAIKGNGFFVVQTDGGERLTRDGKFHISEEGYLVNRRSDRVMAEGGLLNVNDIMVEDNARVTVTTDGMIKVGDKLIDKVLIMSTNDNDNLIKDRDVYFKSSDGTYNIVSADDYEIAQGFLENSNVNPIEEMESMIMLSKNYESAKKIINYLDESLEKANQIGKL